MSQEPVIEQAISVDLTKKFCQPGKSISGEIKRLNFPEDVKCRALIILEKLSASHKRDRKKLQLIFFCIYSSYIELEIRVVPKHIASELGLKYKDINKAFNCYSGCQTGYSPMNGIIIYEPSDFVEYQSLEIGLNLPTINIIRESLVSLLKNSSIQCQLSKYLSPDVSLAFVLYKMKTYGINVDKKEISTHMGKSSSTIDKIIKQIEELDNR